MTVTDEELELGLRSIAVPVRNSHGRIVAAMSVNAPAARVSVADLHAAFLSALQEHAAQLERML